MSRSQGGQNATKSLDFFEDFNFILKVTFPAFSQKKEYAAYVEKENREILCETL